MPQKVPTVRGVPVLLPGHRDTDLCERRLHYHIDRRYSNLSGAVLDGPIVYKDMVKLRELEYDGPDTMWLIILKQGYGTRSKCHVCPHRGLELNGNGRCPGHGLPQQIVAEDVTIDLMSVDRSLGSIRLIDCVLNGCVLCCKIDVKANGQATHVEAHGIRLHEAGMWVSVGDVIELRFKANGD